MSLLENLGREMKPVLAIDAKATEHILHRQGIGRVKHIDVAYLWMQDDIGSKMLRVRRVKSEESVADVGTKPISKAVIAKHCLTLGYVNMAEENVQCKCQGEFTNNQQQKRQQKQHQQADIEQETNEMFVMHYRKMSAGIMEKKNGYTKFHEQFGKFLECAIHEDSTNQTKDIELVCFSHSKSGDELNRLKGAQCVENGWWLSRKDCAGDALAWNACGTNDRRLKIGSSKAGARESPRSRRSRSSRCQWA